MSLNEPSSRDPSTPHPDDILPHLGAVFGINEMAMFVILLELGCVRKLKNGDFHGKYSIDSAGLLMCWIYHYKPMVRVLPRTEAYTGFPPPFIHCD